MNSEGTSLAPINLKVKSCDSALERDETMFAKPDIATHLKEMEQVVICLIGNSMYMYRQSRCTCPILCRYIHAAGRV